MCSFFSNETPYVPLVFPLYRPRPRKLRLRFLNRRRAQLKEAKERTGIFVVGADIGMRNLKLYLENQRITEENEKLRKQAVLLHKENQALLFQLQMKLSEQNNKKPIPSF